LKIIGKVKTIKYKGKIWNSKREVVGSAVLIQKRDYTPHKLEAE